MTSGLPHVTKLTSHEAKPGGQKVIVCDYTGFKYTMGRVSTGRLFMDIGVHLIVKQVSKCPTTTTGIGGLAPF